MAIKRLTKEEIARLKNYAKVLYTREGVTNQKDLAARVGVSENSISKWVNEEGWEKHRASIIITKDEELRRIYMQIVELNDSIMKRPEGERFANTKDADILIKLAGAVKSLETDVALAEAIEVLTKLINLAMGENQIEGKIIVKWADLLIKTLMK